MSDIAWVIALAITVAVLFIIVRRRRAPLADESAYGKWQRDQTVLWHGQPQTVTFDYAQYLKQPMRRRVNVHTLQQSAMGEQTIVGFCHDAEEEQAFKIAGIRGNVLVQQSGDEWPVSKWLELVQGLAPGSDFSASDSNSKKVP